MASARCPARADCGGKSFRTIVGRSPIFCRKGWPKDARDSGSAGYERSSPNVLSRGGRRRGAGRPPTGETIRRSVTWRLPIHLLTRVYSLARVERMSVTAWVERALSEAIGSRGTRGGIR